MVALSLSGGSEHAQMGIGASKAVRSAQCDGRLRAPQVEANLRSQLLDPAKADLPAAI
jgi:hypothetical protein